MMVNLIQIHSVKNVLSHSGCPEDLLESYLQFLQTGGQQATGNLAAGHLCSEKYPQVYRHGIE